VAREDPKKLDIEDLAAFLDTHKKMRKDNENLRAEKEENAHLQEDLTKILRKVKRARRKLHAEEEQRLIAVNEAQGWQERANTAEARTSELENEDRKKKEERDLLKKEKEDWRKAAMKWSTQYATLRTEKLALEDEKKDLETECNAAGGKISSQQTQSRTLQDQVQRASGSLLQQQITSLGKEKEGLMKQVEDLEQAVKDGIYNFNVYKKRVRILGNEF
jgi:chromosome segregation ATPase